MNGVDIVPPNQECYYTFYEIFDKASCIVNLKTTKPPAQITLTTETNIFMNGQLCKRLNLDLTLKLSDLRNMLS